MKWSYTKFLLMILFSGIAMYIVMFANIFEFSHLYNSVMRVYMTLLMIVPMIIIMFGFMWSMYVNTTLNRIIIIWALFVWWITFWAIRQQTWIDDVERMKAMIPHHSSAILTSSRARLQNPEVKKLADQIIKSQKSEIDEMKILIDRLD